MDMDEPGEEAMAMVLKRIVSVTAFVALLLWGGCGSGRDAWCERHCAACHAPCSGYYAPPASAPPQQCVPCCCCPGGPSGYPPAGGWTAPRPANGCCQ